MSMPKISVVMTVYNGERFVKEAVESILGQTFTDFEFIIVDNCSTDKTVKIIRSFEDPRIRLIQNAENLGQTKALNVGIRQARGEFIARMDADDVSLPDRLKTQYEFLHQYPKISVVGSWCIDINEEGKPLRLFKVSTEPLVLRCYLAASGDLTEWGISHPAVMMRKKALEVVGSYNEESGVLSGYPQDYDLWSRLLVKGFQFANIPQPLLKYRILPQSESRGQDKILQYRFEITKNKIKSCMPSIQDADLLSLMNMLEFRPQRNMSEGERVGGIFNEYFERIMTEDPLSIEILRIRDRMRFYYLPQLFKTNKMNALKEFFGSIRKHPGLIWDTKFYRKLFKSLAVWNTSSGRWQIGLKKLFCLR